MAKQKTSPTRTLPHYFLDPPVESRPELLPLHDPNWSWEQFEAFSRDLVRHQPGVVRCHHYGKGGSRQKGIDLYADFQDGRRWTYQCKQRKDFKQADVEKAIAKNTFEGDRHFILLSSELGSEARDACDRHPGWQVWDVRDISAGVRELRSADPDAARRIVEDHFGRHWRSAFLGMPGLATYLSPYDYFRKFLNPKHVFNHTFSLVGREGQLARLDEFVASDEHRVAVIRGRGGIGKTKLLHAFSQGFGERHPGFALRLVPDGVPITPQSCDELASTPLVVVVDDAHRRDRQELGILFEIAQQRRQPLKLVLSLRPSGYEAVHSRLIHAGIDLSEIASVIEVTGLDRRGVEELAAQVLGKSHARLVDRLVEATKDCPLVTVIGGRLLVEKAVAPELLERHDDFQGAVLSKFGDEIIGKVGDRIDPAFCRRLMRFLASVMPFDPLDADSVGIAADFLGSERESLVEAIDHLEEIGVVYRRGRSLRITPDVLADHLLHDACLTTQGRQTGYIRRVYDAFGGVCPAQLLRNLAELDWRVKQASGGGQVDLLSEVWGDIEREFATADAAGRLKILDALMDFSHYQPKRILDIADFALRNPTQEVEDESHPYRMRHRHVLAKLPELLGRVCYSLESLPRACELLWQLGRNDERPTNSNPYHGLRVLADLAGYEPNKPVLYNAAFLGCVERWVYTHGSSEHIGKLCGFLDPLLEKTGHTSHSDGDVIKSEAFFVSEENTRHVRDRVIALLARLVGSDDPRSVLRAVKSLGTALNNPMPVYDMKIGQEECRAWANEQLRILDILDEFISRRRLAIANIRALEAVRWTARHNLNLEVKERASQLRDSIVPDFDMQLTELLLGHCQSLAEEDDLEGDFMTAMARREARRREQTSSLWRQIIQDYPCPRDGLNRLSDCLDLIRMDKEYKIPSMFLYGIGEVSLDYSIGLCEAILGSPERSLAWHFDMLVTPIRHEQPSRGLDLLRWALNSDHAVLWSGVASFYCSPSWIESVGDEDVRLIERLIAHPNLNVRGTAIGTLWNLGKARPHEAKRLALSVDFEGNAGLAEALFQRLEMGIGVPIDQFDDTEIDGLIDKLSGVDKLDDHGINKFLVLASKRRPLEILRMLLGRIDTFEWDWKRDAGALPILGFAFGLEGLAQDPRYLDMLRQVRDRTLAVDYRNVYLIPQLFREITLRFSADCLSVLEEWVVTGERGKVEAVAYLLKEAPPSFVFTQTAFVARLLDIAHAIGEKCSRVVSSHLQAPSITQGRQGVSGQPFPQDIALRDRASEAARSCPPGSLQWLFYDSLATHAVDSIQRSQLHDSEVEW